MRDKMCLEYMCIGYMIIGVLFQLWSVLTLCTIIFGDVEMNSTFMWLVIVFLFFFLITSGYIFIPRHFQLREEHILLNDYTIKQRPNEILFTFSVIYCGLFFYHIIHATYQGFWNIFFTSVFGIPLCCLVSLMVYRLFDRRAPDRPDRIILNNEGYILETINTVPEGAPLYNTFTQN